MEKHGHRRSFCLVELDWRSRQGWQFLDGFHGFEAYGDDLGDEADDVLRVVGAIGGIGDAAAFAGADLVLADG